MPAYNPNKAIELIEDSNTDFVVGMTRPVFEAKDFHTNYFESVNAFRKRINPALTVQEKSAMILEHIAHSCNPFGDIGALIFHRKCLNSLNLGVQAGGLSFTTFPDLDIYLTLFAYHCGAYLGETVSTYVYNDTSPAARRKNDLELQIHGLYAEYEAIMPLYFISAFKLKPLTDPLSLAEKQFLFHTSQRNMSRILGISDAFDISKRQGELSRQYKKSSWASGSCLGRSMRYFLKILAQKRARLAIMLRRLRAQCNTINK
jgi:hypothetical protein